MYLGERALGFHDARARSNLHDIIFLIESLHIHAFAQRNPEFPPLSHREVVQAFMCADHLTVLIMDFTVFHHRWVPLLNKVGKLAFFNKTQVLAFAAWNDGQAAFNGVGLHFRFRHIG